MSAKMNSMFKIEVSYKTGNSFNSYETSELLDFNWNNIDVAKKNLQFIKEHHELISKMSGYGHKNVFEIVNEYSDKEWLVKEYKLWHIPNGGQVIDESRRHKYDEKELEYRLNTDTIETSINLLLDNGKFARIGTFWIGHFETLRSIKIVVDSANDNTEITF